MLAPLRKPVRGMGALTISNTSKMPQGHPQLAKTFTKASIALPSTRLLQFLHSIRKTYGSNVRRAGIMVSGS